MVISDYQSFTNRKDNVSTGSKHKPSDGVMVGSSALCVAWGFSWRVQSVRSDMVDRNNIEEKPLQGKTHGISGINNVTPNFSSLSASVFPLRSQNYASAIAFILASKSASFSWIWAAEVRFVAPNQCQYRSIHCTHLQMAAATLFFNRFRTKLYI